MNSDIFVENSVRKYIRLKKNNLHTALKINPKTIPKKAKNAKNISGSIPLFNYTTT
jgi:hypothetical protein